MSCDSSPNQRGKDIRRGLIRMLGPIVVVGILGLSGGIALNTARAQQLPASEDPIYTVGSTRVDPNFFCINDPTRHPFTVQIWITDTRPLTTEHTTTIQAGMPYARFMTPDPSNVEALDIVTSTFSSESYILCAPTGTCKGSFMNTMEIGETAYAQIIFSPTQLITTYPTLTVLGGWHHEIESETGEQRKTPGSMRKDVPGIYCADEVTETITSTTTVHLPAVFKDQ